MNLKPLAAIFLPLFCVSVGFSQAASSATTPKVGAPAPALGFNHLLGAPVGTKADWPSLRGKVVVLEFWATWCAPCIAEIPVLNALQASLDPAKVQFVSVDDEDPAVVAAFLKKKPISGWVGIDTSSKVFERYGLNSRPDTVVVGPDGRVVSTTLRPEQLKREQLLALAKGKPVKLDGAVDAKVQASLDAGVKQAFAEQMGSAVGAGEALFELRVTAATPVPEGKEPDTHIMMLGPGKMDITESPIELLLSQGAGIAKSRMTVLDVLPKTLYNLNINATNAGKKQLDSAIEMAVASAAGLTIEHKTADTDALVLTALPEGKSHFAPGPQQGFAFYNEKTHMLTCISANPDQIASALELAVGKPVVNESGLQGSISATIPIASKDIAGAKDALAKDLGLTLTPATRPIETVVITPSPEKTKDVLAKP